MIGIICALKIEVEGIQKMMTNSTTTDYARMTFVKGEINGKEVVAVECGIGKVNAAICAQVMIDLFKPEAIINSGIAGALNDKISIGDIVIAKDVVQHDMDTSAIGDPVGLISGLNVVYMKADEALSARITEVIGKMGTRCPYGG